MSKQSNIFVRHKKLWIALAIIIVVVIAGFVLISQLGDRDAAGSARTDTMKLTKMDIEQIVTATGTVKSVDSRSVSASASLNAAVVTVNAEVGQHVKKGDTLCTFDTKMLDLNIAAAQESLSSANAQSNAGLKQAKRRVSEAQKQYSDDKKRLDKEVSKAKKQLDDSKKKSSSAGQSAASAGTDAGTGTGTDTSAGLPGTGLPGTGTGTGTGTTGTTGTTGATGAASAAATSASYKTAYETAKSTRDQTLRADKAQITSAKDALETQQLMDSAAQIESQLEVYEQQKKDAIITAPITGTVTTANAKPGSYPGMDGPLFVIEDIDTLEVTTLVPEYDAAILGEGLGVDIISDAIQGGAWRGEITSISPVATDAAGNFTVTISVTTELGGLKSGMSAKLNIVTDSRQNVFAVPYGALGENAAGESVIYVIGTSKAAGAGADEANTNTSGSSSGSNQKSESPREIVVTTGLETDYYIEVSGPDLTEGMQVLTDPDGLNTEAPEAIPDPETMVPGASEE